MKKVKLMLLSLSILAVVGGTLAFTAKTGNKFCVAATTSSTICPFLCPNLAYLTEAISPNDYICATITTGVPSRPCSDEFGGAVTCGDNEVPIHSTLE